jgi:hypothetical protein
MAKLSSIVDLCRLWISEQNGELSLNDRLLVGCFAKWLDDRPIEPNIVNHDEAYQLACLKQEKSNLARCYLELRVKLGQETLKGPIGWVSPINWEHRQSEIVRKITRNAQPDHGFVVPLYVETPHATPNPVLEEQVRHLERRIRELTEQLNCMKLDRAALGNTTTRRSCQCGAEIWPGNWKVIEDSMHRKHYKDKPCDVQKGTSTT